MKAAMRGFAAFLISMSILSFISRANLLSHSAWLGSDRIGCDCDHCSLPTFLAVPTAAECRTSQVVRQSTLQRSFTLSANKIRSIRRDPSGASAAAFLSHNRGAMCCHYLTLRL